ncbi:MAG: hypothetical protein FD167_3859 [bacterium]|nr:MAG: hypothetical protein FD167_3859 [bacterium]
MEDESSLWHVRCPKCGTSKSYAELGGIRIGAVSKEKRLFGWCKTCQWFRFAIVEKIVLPKQENHK